MGIFKSGQENSGEEALTQMLAYLEDALRLRSPVVLQGPGQAPVRAALNSLSEDDGTFTLLPERAFEADPGAQVAFTLLHEGLRLGGSTEVAVLREGAVILRCPGHLELMERRRLPRARFTAKEAAILTALQDPLEGVGIHSVLDNLSEGGARVRVERALTIGTEQSLVLGPELVLPGQAFRVITLHQLPKCPPELATQGRAVYLDQDAGGLMIGFAFDKPSLEVGAALRRLVGARAKPLLRALPPKARRRREEAVATPSAPEPPRAALEGPDPVTGRERRAQLRLSLGPGFQARFQAWTGPSPLVDMTDLSTGGCCLRLAPESCQDLEAGALLDAFQFLHRDLPNGVLQARVSWILGKYAGERAGSYEDRYCLMGVEFCNPSPEILEGLEAYIAWHIEIE